ncbi:hypothetical protein NQ318_017919 [Aromia moschata]|uniref:peptidylprolyl isomerase n=1 Tax=Aromia moschata TaxID=1265417 RepID=A0AAV8YBW8_9CUCU|nr:hypothetical protein NQ318_017919 [Aromia moschata]
MLSVQGINQSGIPDKMWQPPFVQFDTTNFAELARRGYYNNTIFHRIIKDFMIQGGDPTGTGAGILSMANSGPDTNGSQFFITLSPTQWLDGKHAIFGRIHTGMNVIKRIGLVETDRNDRPVDEIKILRGKVLKHQ